MNLPTTITSGLLLALAGCATDSITPIDDAPTEVFPSTIGDPALEWNLSTPRSYNVTIQPADGAPIRSEFTLQSDGVTVVAFGLTSGATCDACQPDPGPGGPAGLREGNTDVSFPFETVRLGEKSSWPIRYLALPFVPEIATGAKFETRLPENPSPEKLTIALTERTRIVSATGDLVTFETVIHSQLLANEGLEHVLDTSFANTREESAKRFHELAAVEEYYGACQTLWSRSGYIVKRQCSLPSSMVGEEIVNVVVEAQGVADELKLATF